MPGPASASLLASRDFRIFLLARCGATFSLRMLQTIIGWQIYEITNDPLSLGYVGLALYVPALVLLVAGGDAADRFARRLVLTAACAVLAGSACILLILTLYNAGSTLPFYFVLGLISAALGFQRPAEQSYVPFLVPRERLASGVSWSVSANQVGTIVGPVAGGLLYALAPGAVYATAAAIYVATSGAFFAIGTSGKSRGEIAGDTGWRRLREGFTYVAQRPLILGGMSLDFFAVLLGSATALLPIFARDILGVGADGMGVLRSAQAVGAVLTAFMLARWPIERHAGHVLFGAIAVYGLASIVFGLSTSFWLSFVALLVVGSANMASVAVRQTVIQMATADSRRGRVSAVGTMFSSGANDLGDLESGAAAAWVGAVAATVAGGAGTIAVAAIWMWAFPDLRRIDRMRDVKPL